MPDKKRDYLEKTDAGRMTLDRKIARMPKFKSEDEEADWWASQEGRAFVKQKSDEARAKKVQGAGSTLVGAMNKKSSVQIAIRVPQADLAQARKIAERKGIGYQTLLK